MISFIIIYQYWCMFCLQGVKEFIICLLLHSIYHIFVFRKEYLYKIWEVCLNQSKSIKSPHLLWCMMLCAHYYHALKISISFYYASCCVNLIIWKNSRIILFLRNQRISSFLIFKKRKSALWETTLTQKKVSQKRKRDSCLYMAKFNFKLSFLWYLWFKKFFRLGRVK